MKYTREVLEGPVRESKSIAEVMRRLDLRWAGGTHSHIGRRIKMCGLDMSHFLGQRVNRGLQHKGGPDKLGWEVILVKNRSSVGRKEGCDKLRWAMCESGIPYRCAICGSLPMWLDNVLILEIDHVNGDTVDNEKSNVRFLCPNCHSQTETYGSKNIGRCQRGGMHTQRP